MDLEAAKGIRAEGEVEAAEGEGEGVIEEGVVGAAAAAAGEDVEDVEAVIVGEGPAVVAGREPATAEEGEVVVVGEGEVAETQHRARHQLISPRTKWPWPGKISETR